MQEATKAARDINYCVEVRAKASQAAIDDRIRATDSATEIQNTVRAGCEVRLVSGFMESVS